MKFSLPLRGRVVGAKRRPGGAGKANRTNLRPDLIQAIPDQKISVSQGQQPFSGQNSVSDTILSLTIVVQMRTAVDFHDHAAAPALEVQIVASERRLLAKMQTFGA